MTALADQFPADFLLGEKVKIVELNEDDIRYEDYANLIGTIDHVFFTLSGWRYNVWFSDSKFYEPRFQGRLPTARIMEFEAKNLLRVQRHTCLENRYMVEPQ